MLLERVQLTGRDLVALDRVLSPPGRRAYLSRRLARQRAAVLSVCGAYDEDNRSHPDLANPQSGPRRVWSRGRSWDRTDGGGLFEPPAGHPIAFRRILPL
jgi:hypothetical protein